MKKVLIVYFSTSGKTEKMAQFIAEGVRFSGQEATIKKTSDIKKADELQGYDGYIFGSPTYSLDVPQAVKTFLKMVQKAGLEGKPGGAFGTYRHDVSYQHASHAPSLILETLERDYKMLPFELGPLHLKEDDVETGDGMHTSQDYGKVFGEKLAS